MTPLRQALSTICNYATTAPAPSRPMSATSSTLPATSVVRRNSWERKKSVFINCTCSSNGTRPGVSLTKPSARYAFCTGRRSMLRST